MLKNAQSAIKLGMARGMVVLAAARANIEIHEYAPTRAKQAVVGKGSASKPQVQNDWRSASTPPNTRARIRAADALALAICHANTLSIRRRGCTSLSKAY